MELKLIRNTFTEKTTIGDLFINGSKDRECYVLEDKDRSMDSTMSLEMIKTLKVYGETAIPLGRYEIAISYSERFKKKLPLLLNVKGYEGIRIHTGNTELDSHGCLLPCMSFTKDRGVSSTIAFNALFGKIEKALEKEKVFITISR